MLNHSLKSSKELKILGMRKCSKDHNSVRSFCKGVPVNNNLFFVLKFSKICHLCDLKFLMF